MPVYNVGAWEMDDRSRGISPLSRDPQGIGLHRCLRRAERFPLGCGSTKTRLRTVVISGTP